MDLPFVTFNWSLFETKEIFSLLWSPLAFKFRGLLLTPKTFASVFISYLPQCTFIVYSFIIYCHSPASQKLRLSKLFIQIKENIWEIEKRRRVGYLPIWALLWNVNTIKIIWKLLDIFISPQISAKWIVRSDFNEMSFLFCDVGRGLQKWRNLLYSYLAIWN